jgi:hypothetical protein
MGIIKAKIMQGEDDGRALAKIMGFMRAVSVLLAVMLFYWFCYGFFWEPVCPSQ